VEEIVASALEAFLPVWRSIAILDPLGARGDLREKLAVEGEVQDSRRLGLFFQHDLSPDY
jgi:hypothetical protein